MPKTPWRILCVEDNKDSREMMKLMLTTSDENYHVTAVETAAEALDLHSRNPFDLYVLDISLPGMDGMDLCRRIRERGSKKPIIFFSAMVRPNDREYCLAAGANEFLVKPADLEIFPSTVARLLNDAPQESQA